MYPPYRFSRDQGFQAGNSVYQINGLTRVLDSLFKVRQLGFWTQCLNLMGAHSAPGVGDWRKQIAFVSPIL